MADEYKRINLLIGTQVELAAGQEEGMPGIVSDSAYRLGVYAAGAWRLMALRGSSESFADVTLTGGTANALVRLDASKKSAPSQITDDGTNVAIPLQFRQWGTELAVSSRYVKTNDTTIGPSATDKASLLNGATTGFAAVTDPAGRWNAVGAKSRTELAGLVSSSANQALVFELYHNGASKGFIAVPARTYGTNTAWRLVIKQTVRVAGAAGTVRVLMRFYATADNTNSTASCYIMDATLTGIDLTASHTWDVVCTIPNDASNQITCQDAEKIG